MTPAASKMQPGKNGKPFFAGFAPCRELICLRQSVSASVHCFTTAPHFSLTISNGSVPRTRHLRLSETTTESFPAHHTYPNIPAFSRSSSLGAVLYFVYSSLITSASSFFSSPFFISGYNFSCSSRKYLISAMKSSCEICTFFISIHQSFPLTIKSATMQYL